MTVTPPGKMVVDDFDQVTEVNPPEPHARITRPEGTDAYECYVIPVIPGAGPVTLAGDDGERRTMSILNTAVAGKNIVIGHRGVVTSGNGGILPPGVLMPITTIREVCANVPFGVTDPTDVRYVTVLVERNKT